MTDSTTTVTAGQPVTVDASHSTGNGPLTFTFDLTGDPRTLLGAGFGGDTYTRSVAAG